jgi:RNA polymerase subunit RPABC4/transcription elongation factor Spt4
VVRRRLRRACRNCKTIVERGGECHVCGSTDLSLKWDGIIIVIRPEESGAARELGIERKGMYAIRIM